MVLEALKVALLVVIVVVCACGIFGMVDVHGIVG